MPVWEVVWDNLPQIAAIVVLTEGSLFLPVLISLYRKRLLPVILRVLLREQEIQEMERSV